MAQRLNPALMKGFAKSMILFGETIPVGVTTDPVLMATPAGSGTINLNTNGTVFQNYNCNGRDISVNADNCVIRNCQFNATGFHTIYQTGSHTGLLIEKCTFDGHKVNSSHSDFTYADEGLMTIQNNSFFDSGNDHINTVGGVIQKNFMSGGGYSTGAHTDGISIHESFNNTLLITKNYLDLVTPVDAAVPDINSAVKIVAVFGDIDGVIVDQNILLGGGYTIYVQSGVPYYATNVDVVSNYIGLGHWGDLYPGQLPPDLTYTGNQSFSSAPDSIIMVGGGGGATTYIGILRIG